MSAALLAYVLVTQDMGKVAESLEDARVLYFLLWVAVFVLFWLLAEAWFLFVCLIWFTEAGPDGKSGFERAFSYYDLVRARAASYLLTALNFMLGYGGLVVYLKRRFGVPYGRGSAVMMNELLHEFASLGILAAGAVALVPKDLLPEEASLQVEIAFKVGVGAALFYLACFALSMISRFMPAVISRRENLFTPFVWSPVWSWPLLLLIKLVQNGTYGLFVMLTMPAFGLHPPEWASMAFTQVVRIARGLPISAFGIGIDQLTFPFLFQGTAGAGEGDLVAFSIAFTFSLIAARFAFGLPFFARASREMWTEEDD